MRTKTDATIASHDQPNGRCSIDVATEWKERGAARRCCRPTRTLCDCVNQLEKRERNDADEILDRERKGRSSTVTRPSHTSWNNDPSRFSGFRSQQRRSRRRQATLRSSTPCRLVQSVRRHRDRRQTGCRDRHKVRTEKARAAGTTHTEQWRNSQEKGVRRVLGFDGT
jgi:hypothetical protein